MGPGHPSAVRALVIGGGVVGLASAIALQRRGFETVLIERAACPRGASWGNAGHIATEQVEPLASPATLRGFPRRLFWRGGAVALPLKAWRQWLPFAGRFANAARPARFAAGTQALGAMLGQALPAWRRLLAEAGASDLLHENGHWVVWESSTSAAAGKARWAAADIGETRIREPGAAERARLDAMVPGGIAGAIRFEGSGHIADLELLAERVSARFEALGGVRLRAEAVSIARHDGGVEVRLADGGSAAGDIAVVAGGAASAPLLRPHGHCVPLIAERGYHIQADVGDPDWPADMPPVVFEDRSMIVTRFRSALRAASFVEFASTDLPPDPRKWARLRKHAAALGLPIGPDASEWMGARPTLPDYLPAVGRSAAAPEILYAFGHQHLGLTLAACTGAAIGALAAGEAPPFDLAPFDLGRFG